MSACAKLGLSVVILAVLSHSIDVRGTFVVIYRISLPYAAGATLLLALSVAVIVPRWRAILLVYGYDVSRLRLLSSVYAGFFINQLLPTAIGGDFFRANTARKGGVPTWRAASSVLVDRIFGIFAALFLLGVGVTIAVLRGAGFPRLVIFVGGIVVFVLFIILVLVLALRPHYWGDRLERLAAPVKQLSRDLVETLTDELHGPKIMLFSVLAQLIPVFALKLIAAGSGVDIDWTTFLIIGPMTMLVSAVPLSFAGWGLREGALVYMLQTYGIAPSTALGISLLFGALMLLASLPGVFALFARDQPLE